MKLKSLNAVGMGKYQNEIVDWIERFLLSINKDYDSSDEIDFKWLIESACEDMSLLPIPVKGEIICVFDFGR